LGFSVAAVSVFLLLFSTQIVMAAFPLMDVVGVGGFYLEAEEFTGEEAEVYPVEGDKTGPTGPADPDTPVCENRPMMAIELNTAFVDGFVARKDLQLPHLEDRWMSIEISQPTGGQIDANRVTFFVTQLGVDDLTIRNVIIREAQDPNNPRAEPRFMNPSDVSNQKFGPNSNEFYIEGGNSAQGKVGLSAVGAEAWLHAVTAQSVEFSNTQGVGIEVDISFPTNTGVENFYEDNSRLGYDEEFKGGGFGVDRDANDRYFDCLPVEAQ
jgi:hypothetical protein